MKRALAAAIAITALCIVLAPKVGGDKPAVIVDTDAGSDDVLALAFLLTRRDVPIEAVTVVNGLAHVEAGAAMVARLVALAGRPEIKVLRGATAPLQGQLAFPDEWRRQADSLGELAGLPRTAPAPADGAIDYLARRLGDPRHPVRVLALGPLTNLAAAVRRADGHLDAVEEVVAMGGAFDTPGNAPGDEGEPGAEWNFHVDPVAARAVLEAGMRLTLVALDATRTVPISGSFATAFRFGPLTPLGAVVGEVLMAAAPEILAGHYDAWDPLAAAAFLDRSLITTRRIRIDVATTGPDAGRTSRAPAGGPEALVAVDASAGGFTQAFFGAFASR